MIAKGFLEAIFEDKLDFDNEEVNTLNQFKQNEDKALIFKAIMSSYGLHPNKYLNGRGEFLLESFESPHLTIMTGSS